MATAHWTTLWTAMPQVAWQVADHLPPDTFATFENTTLRQTVRLGTRTTSRIVRLRLSNTFGTAALGITRATIGIPVRPGVDDVHLEDDVLHTSGSRFVDASTLTAVTFSGQLSVTIAAGSLLLSDAITLSADTLDLSITLYFEHGLATPSITTHPGSRTQSWLCLGDQTESPSLKGGDALCSVLHWYFLAGVEEFTSEPRRALVLLGDSITDGRCSTDNGNDRWPDLLRERLPSTAVLLNQSAGGNCLLREGTGGPALLDRLERDVLSQPGVAGVLVCGGVNDIGTSNDSEENSTATVAARLIGVYEAVIDRCAAAGLSVLFATITPFYGPGQVYSSPARVAARQTVNAWIRTQAMVVDFDQVLRDPEQPSRLREEFDSGDHLHPNVAGFRAMAAVFPVELLEVLQRGST
ncbi:hypothetical protein SEUCBS140593_006519 [Sporothrix eucalyptigena]|uniref:SGNH hydrolase-type esterase domain-containing protein n=1 Tax=Sporothrix eucalyptigena TaxID=1812306 RepID=A0ABP0C6H8_9PEZI